MFSKCRTKLCSFKRRVEPMDIDAISKALSNPLRRQILQWLKEPAHYLPVEECGGSFEKGVCAGHIERLGKVAQSTMSNHLSVLQQAGLIQVQKYGQWSYFSRNEALIQQYIEHLKQTL